MGEFDFLVAVNPQAGIGIGPVCGKTLKRILESWDIEARLIYICKEGPNSA